MMDPMASSRVSRGMTRRLGAVLLCFAVACGGGSKKDKTTPDKKTDGQSMKDNNDPEAPPTGNGTGAGSGVAGGGAGSGSGSGTSNGAGASEPSDTTPQVTYPNLDPDPAQAKTQVDAHLAIAKNALAQPTPDGDAALKEARIALTYDAASVDAAAMVAFAYYHKKLYETAELVLDDLFKRDTAKNNAQVYYVYGLVYDKTNRPDRAELAFQKAVGLDPNHASAMVNLGVHFLQNGRYDEAEQLFERLSTQFKRTDAVTLTSLGAAYRGRSADFPPGGQRDQYVVKADGAFKRATKVNASYGPAYYNLGLLYLENDPFPGLADPLMRLNAAKGFFDQYKNMPGVDIKLYDDRMKDVTKLIKREEKKNKKKKNP